MHAALFDQICEAFDINVLEVEDFCTPLILLLNMRFVDTMLILFNKFLILLSEIFSLCLQNSNWYKFFPQAILVPFASQMKTKRANSVIKCGQ